MVKIFVTGDNHIGRKYDRYPDIKTKLIESRFECLQDMVRKAEEEGCDFFVVTGDLFDNINSIKVGDVKKVVKILSAFNGRVLVLPGNHDYYTGDDKVWRDFENALSSTDHNITVLNEFKPYTFDDVEDKDITIYPAFCHSKHSEENNLRWIKNTEVDVDASVNIGIAHGALKGVTPDIKEEYFLMSEEELNSIPVDVWLIGHTHIAYPGDLDETEETTGYKIFNAGTHEQTDLSNNSEGDCFIIRIEKEHEKATVYAKKYISGKIRYYDIKVHLGTGMDLKGSLEKAIECYATDSVIRVTFSGTISKEDYEDRKKIYDDVLGKYLTFEVNDDELSEEITIEKIRSEFAETSFAAQFLEQLIDKPTELQMAYKMLQECIE